MKFRAGGICSLTCFCIFEEPCQCCSHYIGWSKAGSDGNFLWYVVKLTLIEGTLCLVSSLRVCFALGQPSLTARKVGYYCRRGRPWVLSLSLLWSRRRNRDAVVPSEFCTSPPALNIYSQFARLCSWETEWTFLWLLAVVTSLCRG